MILTIFLVAAAIVAWTVILFGWPPFEFVHSPAAQTPPPTPPPNITVAVDLQHVAKIVDSLASHSNFIALCFVGVVWIVAWMAIKITKIHVENPRTVYYYPPPGPPGIEKPKEEYRGNLPAKT